MSSADENNVSAPTLSGAPDLTTKPHEARVDDAPSALRRTPLGRRARPRSSQVTIYDVAADAEVSPATVSRVLTGSSPVAQDRHRRVLASVEKLGFRPNSVAQSLATSSTRTIAVLLPDITNQFFPDLVKGIQLLADERHYSVLLCQTNDQELRERDYLDLAIRRRLDGLIMIGLHVHLDLQPGDLVLPIVSLDRRVNIANTASVEYDNCRGATIAVRHLLDLGHRRIAHLGGPRDLEVARAREDGWRAAHGERDVPIVEELIVPGDFSEGSGRRAMEELLERGVEFSAVFAANDLIAFGAMTTLTSAGAKVPEDVSVVGFDGIERSLHSAPALTTVRQPAYDMGRCAAALLVDRIEAVETVPACEKVVFPPELIVRGSTASKHPDSRVWRAPNGGCT